MTAEGSYAVSETQHMPKQQMTDIGTQATENQETMTQTSKPSLNRHSSCGDIKLVSGRLPPAIPIPPIHQDGRVGLAVNGQHPCR
ncbi:hypothetical protein E2C01_062485 [Portunus trituberculatus]|uniref:Uncharacterized protein n=1 Tax=Portunus trituberculatus TaxID=210409 RepID=A0A5B7HG83_PORTR|nr:hypothetical protein [Portunus trituberculatus]